MPETKENQRPPRGRDDTRAALVDAATELFAERGPASVSAREIARHAGVNHGLVHRHFGSKRELVGAVLDRVRDSFVQAAASADGDAAVLEHLFATAAGHDVYVRVMARMILDHDSSHDASEEPQRDFPAIDQIVRLFRDRQARGELDDDYDPRLLGGATVALVLGWLLFEPMITKATGLDPNEPEQTRQALLALMIDAVTKQDARPSTAAQESVQRKAP